MTDLHYYRIMVRKARKDYKDAKDERKSICKARWAEYKRALSNMLEACENAALCIRSCTNDGKYSSLWIDNEMEHISESEENFRETRCKCSEDVEAADKKVRATKKALALLRRPVLEFEANIKEKERQFWEKIKEQKLQFEKQLNEQQSLFKQECVEQKKQFNKQLKELVSAAAKI
jgi:hypothetical protein